MSKLHHSIILVWMDNKWACKAGHLLSPKHVKQSEG